MTPNVQYLYSSLISYSKPGIQLNEIIMMDKFEEHPWYNLKYSIAEFLIPRLEEYKLKFIESGVSIPTWVSSDMKEPFSDEDIEKLNSIWISDLDLMIQSFKLVLNYKYNQDEIIPYDRRDIQKGIDLFARHYQHFWD